MNTTISNKSFKPISKIPKFLDGKYITYENCEFERCFFKKDMSFITFISCKFNDCEFGNGNCVLDFFEFNKCLFFGTYFFQKAFNGIDLNNCLFYDCHITSGCNIDEEDTEILGTFNKLIKKRFIKDFMDLPFIQQILLKNYEFKHFNTKMDQLAVLDNSEKMDHE